MYWEYIKTEPQFILRLLSWKKEELLEQTIKHESDEDFDWDCIVSLFSPAKNIWE